MLNRRLLRIKALQAVYAYQQAVRANRDIIADQIKEHYFEQWSIEGGDSRARWNQHRDQVLDFVREQMDRTNPWTDLPDELEDEVEQEGIQFLKSFHERNLKEFFQVKTRFLQSTKNLTGTYIGFIEILKRLGDCTQREKADKSMKPNPKKPYDGRLDQLYEHPFLVCLRNDEQWKKAVANRGEKYDQDQIEEWYQTLKSTQVFQEALRADAQEEQDLLRVIVRDLLFKHEAFLGVFEENDLSWTENQAVLKSLVVKTLKEAKENQYDQIRLLTLSRDWEEDEQFFTTLYEKTLQEELANHELIQEKSVTWASNRIAALDLIMINMAMTEMRYFPSIPVKVTLNEYIDISKQYSTPKSWQFINGMLDSIVKELKTRGEIRKSGRGLLDNR